MPLVRLGGERSRSSSFWLQMRSGPQEWLQDAAGFSAFGSGLAACRGSVVPASASAWRRARPGVWQSPVPVRGSAEEGQERAGRGCAQACGIAPAAGLKPSKEAAALAAGACHTGNTTVTPRDSSMTYGRLLGVGCVTGGGQRKMTTRSRVKEAGGILTEDVEI